MDLFPPKVVDGLPPTPATCLPEGETGSEEELEKGEKARRRENFTTLRREDEGRRSSDEYHVYIIYTHIATHTHTYIIICIYICIICI